MYLVTISQQSNVALLCYAFGRDVSDAQSARAARESAIGDQRDGITKWHSLRRLVSESISRIPDRPFGPFAVNDDYIARVNDAIERRSNRCFFSIEHTRRTRELQLMVLDRS